MGKSSGIHAAGGRITSRQQLSLICVTYLVLSAIFGSVNLDVDEFGFIKEPYEMVGGDYTRGYLAKGDFASAASVALRSYYFYWKYRPLFSPLIEEEDKRLFRQEEARFGYTVPVSVDRARDPGRIAKHSQRLVVPESERFYRHGAGKPLLPALLSIPQLGLVQLLSTGQRALVAIQYTRNYHPIFILSRLAQLLSGLLTVLLVYWILAREFGADRAVLGAAVTALFPLSIRYFPNLHHDAILVPFLLLAAYFFVKERYVKAGICFGLSLASKNTAIFLAPIFLAWALWSAHTAARSGGQEREWTPVARGIRGWTIVMLAGALVLLPFANPVSFMREILSPVLPRQFDPRGEDVSSFTVDAKLHAPARTQKKYAVRSDVRPEVRLLNLVSGFRDTGILFIALAALCLLSRQNGPMARMCLMIVFLAVPYGLVFGYGLSYRALMFVPFFAILAADVGRQGPLLGLLALSLVVDVVYCLDPMTVGTMHYPATKDTFVSALLGWLGPS